jgi:uncharacterized protein with GYD domain
MATFITLANFTDQGIRTVKESPHRAEAFTALAAKVGLTVKSLYWTAGSYDIVVVSEGSDEAAMTALLATGQLGNVRTQTLRAFNASEMQKIINNIPKS